MRVGIWISTVFCILLCGCGIEPEDRDFVTAVGFDKGFEAYILTAEGNSGEDTSEKNKSVTEGTGKNISEAVEACGLKSSGELFFGHTTLCIADISLLSDKTAVNEMVNYMEKDTQISRRVVIMASDDPKAVLEGENGGKDAAEFISEYYRSHTGEKPTELDRLCIALKEKGDIVIPAINATDKSFEISGGILMADGAAVKKLTDEEMRCVKWLDDDGSTGYINVETDNNSKFVKVKKKSIVVKPDKIIIKVEPENENSEITDEILTLCMEKIKQEAQAGLKILYDEDCDLMRMERAFEKGGIDKPEDSKYVDINTEIAVIM